MSTPASLLLEIVHLSDQSKKLPRVKFMAGKITLSLKTMSVSFTDKMICEIKGMAYIYDNGKWFHTQLLEDKVRIPIIIDK
jgi:hypothetical protein